MKYFIALALFFCFSNSYSQDNSVTNLDEALKEMRVKPDAFTGNTLYFSKRTPENLNDVDRLLAYITKASNGNSKPYLRLMVSHVADQRQSTDFAVDKVIILIQGRPFTIKPTTAEIKTNGRHVWIDAHVKDSKIYEDIIKSIIASETKVTARFYSLSSYIEFEISKKEKKALNDVLTTYYLLIGK